MTTDTGLKGYYKNFSYYGYMPGVKEKGKYMEFVSDTEYKEIYEYLKEKRKNKKV